MARTSLLTAIDSTLHIHLIVGSNSLASARCARSLEVGATPILIAPESADLHFSLQKRIESKEIRWIARQFEDEDLFQLGREEIDRVIDAVFVTLKPRDPISKEAPRIFKQILTQIGIHISELCKQNRIPVNVSDAPSLCTFSLLATHTDGPLQIGVTTNGQGCKLSSRIRREIASFLSPQLGTACQRLGTIRRRIQQEDYLSPVTLDGDDKDDSVDQTADFNKLVTEADLEMAKSRRIRWLSQICEYWPLQRLTSISDEDVETMLKSYVANPSSLNSDTIIAELHSNSRRGRIILAGSGPGHPDLLTKATHKAILRADLVLADKLVPSGVLDLIPRRTPVHIARKFPGNAERAQEELLELGLAGLKKGQTVLRLKQGDPYIYGRGGEEVEFFSKEGFAEQITLLPGITSALSAPLFASIPATQRGVSDQVLICTGTGQKGKPTVPPEFVETRTVVFLMALHRIKDLVTDLTSYNNKDAKIILGTENVVDRTLWPKSTPCAVIERASCPDQRVIRTNLEFVATAIEVEGSRPPGLLVVGRACEALCKLEADQKWTVEEGFTGFDLEKTGLEDLVLEKERLDVELETAN